MPLFSAWLRSVRRGHAEHHGDVLAHNRRGCIAGLGESNLIALGLPSLLQFLAAIGVVSSLLGLLAGGAAGALALVVLAGYLLGYEWVHTISHFPSSHPWLRVPGLRYMRNHHLDHHAGRQGARRSFGILTPIWDLALRTGRERGAVS